MNIPSNLYDKLKKRKQENALRSLKQANDKIDFSSNDYLGFASSEPIYQNSLRFLEAKVATKNGSTGSRLLTGNHPLYASAEAQLAKFHKAPAALVYNSGYTANLGVLGALLQRGDILLYDEYIHASLRDGLRVSNAKAYKFKHNDLGDLSQKLERLVKAGTTTYIVTESIFSMDGDQPDLLKLVEVSKAYGAFIIIDEAHATGVIGPKGVGLVQTLGLEQEIFVRIHTFGKAIGCHGAVVLGDPILIDYLINFSRPLIYSTALSPHSLANIMAAYQELEVTEMAEQLQERINFFNSQLIANKLSAHFIPSNSSIHCCIIAGNESVKQASKVLFDQGFDVKPVLSPTVPGGQERLRFCIHSYNSKDEIVGVLGLLKEIIH